MPPSTGWGPSGRSSHRDLRATRRRTSPVTAPTVRATDNITAHLPLENPQLGNVYTVIVGFQLSQSELKFNRAHQQ